MSGSIKKSAMSKNFQINLENFKPGIWEVFKNFILHYTISILFVISIGFLLYNNHRQDLLLVAETQENIRVKEHSEILQQIFISVQSDILILNHYLSSLSTSSGMNPVFLDTIKQYFLTLSNSKNVYDQIRFIDKNGLEKIRVNYSDQASLVPDDELQDKSLRYYFTDVIALDENEVFLSPMDLNIEHGEIEQPIKPMIRIGTPLVVDGVKLGVVIFNYVPNEILEHFGHMPFGLSFDDLFLINAEGHQLQGPDSSRNWTFMYPEHENISFAMEYPDKWSIINASKTGQFYTDNGLYSFFTLYPLADNNISSTGSSDAFMPSDSTISDNSYYWKIVSFISFDSMLLSPANSFYMLFVILVGLTIILFFIGYLLSRNVLIKDATMKAVESNERKLEKTVKSRTNDLNERIKELECLYGTVSFIQDTSDLDKIFQAVADFIPLGWQFPEITRSKITIEGKEYVSEPFTESNWKQSANIMLDGKKGGVIEVYYLHEKPDMDEGPFLKEERDLIDNLSSSLSKAIAHDNDANERNIALQEAQNANKVKDLFLANISHEIRTPLNSILGFSEIIKEKFKDKLDEEETDFFKIINNSGKRLINTVHEILDISQIEAGTADHNPKVIGLAKEIELIFLEFQPTAKTKNLDFKYTNNIDNGTVMVDETSLSQAVSNLIDNAIKYTEKGQITISLDRLKGNYVLSISDTGIGMSASYLKHLFETFSQESSGYSKKYQGLGLGLSIAKNRLDMNNIPIKVESKKDVGTTFTLTFTPETATVKKAATRAPATMPSTSKAERPLVLIVEDDENNRKTLEAILKKDYDTCAATTVKESKELLKKQTIGMVLLDISLGQEESGLDLSKYMKQHKQYKDIPIVAVTGHAFDADRQNALNAGCDDYMSKPIDIKKLLEKIKAFR